MTIPEIAGRCARELRNSKSKPMLQVARRYSVLFIEYMFRHNVTPTSISTADLMLRNIYKRILKKFE